MNPRLVWRCGATLAAGAMLAALSGCGSVSVSPQVDNALYRRLTPPAVIYVKPFDITAGTWASNVSAQSARTRIRNDLTEKIVEELSLFSTAQEFQGITLPADGWLITGKFVQVANIGWVGTDVGGVGLGVEHGRAVLETEVTVYDLAESTTDPLFVFTTKGGAGNLLPVDVGVRLTESAKNRNLDASIWGTAHEIRAFLEHRLSSQ